MACGAFGGSTNYMLASSGSCDPEHCGSAFTVFVSNISLWEETKFLSREASAAAGSKLLKHVYLEVIDFLKFFVSLQEGKQAQQWWRVTTC